MESNPQIDRHGCKFWYNDKNQMHRTDGPAVVYPNGYQAWYKNNKRHRTDGPARIFADGRLGEWYIDGKEVKPIPNIIISLRKKLNKKKLDESNKRALLCKSIYIKDLTILFFSIFINLFP